MSKGFKMGYGRGKGSYMDDVRVSKVSEYDRPYFLRIIYGPDVYRPFWYSTFSVDDDDSVRYYKKLIYDSENENSVIKLLGMLEKKYYESINEDRKGYPAFQTPSYPLVIALDKGTNELGLWELRWRVNSQLLSIQSAKLSIEDVRGDGTIDYKESEKFLQHGPLFLYTVKITRTHKPDDKSFRGVIYDVEPHNNAFDGKIERVWYDKDREVWNLPEEIESKMFTETDNNIVNGIADGAEKSHVEMLYDVMVGYVEGIASDELIDTFKRFPINLDAEDAKGRRYYDTRLCEFLLETFKDDPVKLSILHAPSLGMDRTGEVPKIKSYKNANQESEQEPDSYEADPTEAKDVGEKSDAEAWEADTNKLLAKAKNGGEVEPDGEKSDGEGRSW